MSKMRNEYPSSGGDMSLLQNQNQNISDNQIDFHHNRFILCCSFLHTMYKPKPATTSHRREKPFR